MLLSPLLFGVIEKSMLGIGCLMDRGGLTMNTVSVLCLVVVLLLIAGCQTEHVWVKDGASQQDFNMDAGECKAQAFGTPEVSPIYSSCMSGKGWYSVDKPEQ